ncbi:serine acetyltransferase [Nitrincola tibetensis]|uniref:serine O-acetyltransferase n=1 Tax=Nitrincola tibetensis TaxID=2219697 RepID=A0A364NIG6_9GAMM|nr:serine O-acetyltransferase EpsC [Nitrincola tibetensis]RAU16675.1 serine acetyltransferase [Nitrincola tibetensis]
MSNVDWGLDGLVSELRARREHWRRARQRDPEINGREFPSLDVMHQVSEGLASALFPMRLGPSDLKPKAEDHYIGYTLDKALNTLLDQAVLELRFGQNPPEPFAQTREKAIAAIREFALRLPDIRSVLDTDVEAAYKGDPAARSMDEVLLCYPGVRAIIFHRLSHELFKLGLPLLARIMAEISHSETGIDIHPGATIGESFFIDHGTGVVIGETTIIGRGVRIYQAVTLGAKRFEVDEQGSLIKGGARHPVIEDQVVIYAGATLLGRITIGRGSSIGGNVWLTHSVPPNSQITQANHEQRCEEQRAKGE